LSAPSVSTFFFFSSRRRHTRFSRDWSSDVCSSDLDALPLYGLLPGGLITNTLQTGQGYLVTFNAPYLYSLCGDPVAPQSIAVNRSEERRVGKECRYRWLRQHTRRRDERKRATRDRR